MFGPPSDLSGIKGFLVELAECQTPVKLLVDTRSTQGVQMYVYAPLWLVNRSGLELMFMKHGGKVKPNGFVIVLCLLTMLAKNIGYKPDGVPIPFNGKKIQIRTADGKWSEVCLLLLGCLMHKAFHYSSWYFWLSGNSSTK